jgi:DNA-binding transcriptional LysR family regulator
MELRHYKYFMTVAEELNFSRAAERLHIVQPALSKQIAQMEYQLGVPLFVRTKRSVRLTEAGIRLMADARLFLRAEEDAIRSARMAGRGELGEVSVGFVASSAFVVLPRLLRAFSAAYPAVELRLTDMTTSEQSRALLENGIDLGFIRPPSTLAGLDSFTVAREAFIAVLPRDHPLAAKPALDLADLASERFVVLSRDLAPGLFSQVERICGRAGFSPLVAETVGQLDIAVAFVAAGMGVSILPASISAFAHEGVRYLGIADSGESAEIAMAWKDKDASPATRSFIASVRQTLGGVPISIGLA